MSARRTGEEIVDAVAAAAHRLFVQRGPAAVSVREIAGEAGVNLGLIHRYVGSKDDVIALVLDRHGERTSRALQQTSDLDDIIGVLARSPSTSSGRLFGGIALDGVDALRLKREFPVADALTTALADEAGDVDSAQTAALLQALVLGWEIFAPYLLGAAGANAPDDEEALLREAMERLARISAHHPVGESSPQPPPQGAFRE